MTRKKINLAYIANDTARKATFKKRRKGFLKKIYELSTLCEVKACALIYSPYVIDRQPEVWPDAAGARHILSKFQRIPAMEKSKKMVDQRALLRQRIEKATEQVNKIREHNEEKEIEILMYDWLGGTIDPFDQSVNLMELQRLNSTISKTLKHLSERIETLKKEEAPQQPLILGKQQQLSSEVQISSPPPLLLPPPPPPPFLPPLPNDQYMILDQFRAYGDDVVTMNDDVNQQQPLHGERGTTTSMSWYTDLLNSQEDDYQLGGFGGGGTDGGGSNAASYSLNSMWPAGALFFP